MKLRRRWWRRHAEELTCQEVGRVLQGYLDGELDGSDVPAVEAHLDACRRCGLEAASYLRIKAALAQPMPEDVDPGAIDRLREFGRQLTDDS